MRLLLVVTGLLNIFVASSSAYKELDTVVEETQLLSDKYDVVVFVNNVFVGLETSADYAPIQKAINVYQKLDKGDSSVKLIPFLQHPSKRLILAPTGALNTDTADSRLIYKATAKAFDFAYTNKYRRPLLVVGPLETPPPSEPWKREPYPTITSILGALHELYTPLQVRESRPDLYPKYDRFGIFNPPPNALKWAKAIEEGRYITRDLCATDEERMTPRNVEAYMKEHMASSQSVAITYELIDGNKYPMMAAVDRLYEKTDMHKGRVIKLAYPQPNSTEPVKKTIYLIGKGITFDTGGYSLKTSGGMRFMRKDKCGASAIVGFFRVLDLLRPVGLEVHGRLSFVRNGIGADAYTVDEVIYSHAKRRSRIGSTDAEGRNVMVDLLAEAVQEVTEQNKVNPHLFTIATLTGHVALAFGKIPAIMDNGPGREKGFSKHISDSGALIGDLAEVSTIRREDYQVCYPVSEYEDLQQRNTHPDTVTYRGHQYPAAWMILASGLDQHGLDSKLPIPYTHMDVSNAVGVKHMKATGTPVPMLVSAYILPSP